MNDLNHDAQQVSVYLELDALPCGAACVAVGPEYPHIHSEWDPPSMLPRWSKGCDVMDTGSHFDPTLARVVGCAARSLPLGHARGTATHHLPASMRCAC